MRKFVSGGMMAACVMAAAAPASAALVYDTSLASPPGVYFGASNLNNHFVVNTTGGTELGLATVERFIGNYTPDAGTSIYRVPLGNTVVAGKQGSAWGFTFSLNNGPNGPRLSAIVPTLSILDVATGSLVSFNPLIIPDNAGFGPNGKNVAIANIGTDYAFQNSEALSFTNGVGSFFDPTYDANRNDTYVVTLSASCTAACERAVNDLGSVTETIIVGSGAPSNVPEPASAAVLGMALAAAATRLRRK